MNEQADEPGYQQPADDVGFGDIFSAHFLLDLFAREDTTLLGGGTLPANLTPKLGKWLGGELDAEEAVVLSVRLPPKQTDRYALAHASLGPPEPRLAILVSDSCLAATALAQGRQKRSPSGRLLFAPVNPVDEETWQPLVDNIDFERMALPPIEGVDGHLVAELRHVFMVDAVHLHRHLELRVASCNAALAESLEEYWNGYATRRGPLSYERNLLKLAWLLSGAQGDHIQEQMQQRVDLLAAALDLAWQLEGADLEDISDVEETVRVSGANVAEDLPAVRDTLIGRLEELAQAAAEAAHALRESA